MNKFSSVFARLVVCAAAPLSFSALASTQVNFTGLGEAGTIGTAITLSTSSRYVTVAGVAFDSVNGTAPANLAVELIPQSPLSGAALRAPVTIRTDATPILLQNSIQRPTSALLDAMANAGFIATIDTSQMPDGTYRISSAMVNNASTQANTSVTLTLLPRTPDTVTIKDSTGAAVGTAALVYVPGGLTFKSYPSLRSGSYRAAVPAADYLGRPGEISDLVFNYVRPTQTISLTNPQVLGFPGQRKIASLTNPLTGEALTGSLAGVATLANPGVGVLNGINLSSGQPTQVSLPAALDGSGHRFAASTAETVGDIRVWVDAPDAPDVKLTTSTWTLDGAMVLKPSNANFSYTAALEPVSIKTAAATEQPARCKSVPFAVQSTDNPAARGVDARDPQCAIRWSALPAGLAQLGSTAFAELTGYLTDSTLGSQSLTFEPGVIYTDPDTAKTQFYPATPQSATIISTEPLPITFSFKANAPLEKARVDAGITDSTSYFVTVGNKQLPGSYLVSSPYMGLEITTQFDGEAPKTETFNQRAVQALAFVTTENIGQRRDMTIKARYLKKPDTEYSKTFTFSAIPSTLMILLDRPTDISNISAVTLSGKFGRMNAAREFAFDSSTMGNWSIAFSTVSRGGVPARALGVSTTSIGADGTFSVPVGNLPVGTFDVVAIATLTTDVSGYETTFKSDSLWLTVRDGSDLPVVVSAQTKSGALPFNAVLMANFSTALRASDMSAIRWQRLSGATWETVTDAAGAPEKLTQIRPVITAAGDYTYRAIVTNRWTNAETTTNEVTISGFVRPAISLTGPTGGLVGYPVTIAIGSDLSPGDLLISWTVKQGTVHVASGASSTITFTPTSAGTFAVAVSASQTTAPTTDPNRIRNVSGYFVAVQPRLNTPSITGTRSPEVGKTYTYKGSVTSIFPPGTVVTWVTKSKWVLPDGTEQPGDADLTLTVGSGTSQELRYVAWLDGVPNSETTATLALNPWTYTWPTWTMTSRLLDTSAPARVQLQMLPSDQRALAALNGEPLTYTWNLPATATSISQLRENATITLPQGSFVITGTITDTRGHVTNVSSPAIQVGPPSELLFTVDASNSSDRYNRAPLTVGVTVRVTSLPRLDAFASADFILDGALVGTLNTPFGTLIIPTAGQHTLQVLVRSRNGQTATRSVDLTVVDGDAPACNLVAAGSSPLTLTATCTVQAGYVAGYEWYLNSTAGTTTKVGGARVLAISAADLARTASITFKALTDKTKSTTLTWTKP